MRDDPTVRLNADAGGAPDDGASQTTQLIGTVKLPSVPDASDGAERHEDAAAGHADPAVDHGAEAATTASPRAAEEGHVPGPGLVIPPAAREPRVHAPIPDGRPVMPGGSADDRGGWPGRDITDGSGPDAPIMEGAAEWTAALPLSAPSGESPDDRGEWAGRDTCDASRPGAPIMERPAMATRTAAPPHRPSGNRPVTAPSAGARPAAPPRPAGPRPTGPGRPAAVAPAQATPRASSGPSRARTSPRDERPSRSNRLRRRAGGIVGGLVLGLVAIVSASWTLLVPPDVHGTRSDERPAAAAAKPAAPAVRWVRTGGDEFDGSALDRSRWNVYNSVGGFGNGLRRPSAVAQDGGLLTITARPRRSGGTTGGISLGDGQLHGRWEFRARADPGVGYSPAVLLWPDSERFPIDGELDMLEAPDGNRRTASAYVHYGADNKTRGAQVSGDFTQWHTFAFEWLPDRITWYVDGQKAWEVTDRTVIPTKPMHLCIQLDQGPAVKFMPAPDASTPEQVRMQVDWARQYRVG